MLAARIAGILLLLRCLFCDGFEPIVTGSDTCHARSSLAMLNKPVEPHSAYKKRILRLDSRWGSEEVDRVVRTQLSATSSDELNIHPAYMKRASRLDLRWGAEEKQRLESFQLHAHLTSIDFGSSGQNVHPAYTKRSLKLDSRWGAEERQRLKSFELHAQSPSASGSNGLNVHPAYAKRNLKLDSRWGAEESQRLKSFELHAQSPSSSSSNELNVHPAYAKRSSKLDARWGSEEHSRIHSTKLQSLAATATSDQTLDVHPAYAKRAAKGPDTRWGAEEHHRLATTNSNQVNGVEVNGQVVGGFEVPGMTTLTLNGAAEAVGETAWHPAYKKRIESAGFESRWGAEEAARVAASKSAGYAQIGEKVDSSHLMHQNAALLEELKDTRHKLAAKEKEIEDLHALMDKAKKEAAAEAVASVTEQYEKRIERLQEMLKFANEKLQGQATASSSQPVHPHPAYKLRSKSAGLSSRWGAEEIQRFEGSQAHAPSERLGTLQEMVEPNIPSPVSEHPAYTARKQQAQGLESRWGTEELSRIGAVSERSGDRLSILQELIEPNIPSAQKSQ